MKTLTRGILILTDTTNGPVVEYSANDEATDVESAVGVE